MRSTGILRKVDELGRIVIPKEIRKNFRIREGDPLEIYVEKNGEILLKKYAPFGSMLDTIIQYADALAITSGMYACVTDTETVITMSGLPKQDQDYVTRALSDHVINVMEERAIWSTKVDSVMPIIDGENTAKYKSQIISPIICDADAVGAVILFSFDNKKKITDVEYKLAQTASYFLGKQMEP